MKHTVNLIKMLARVGSSVLVTAGLITLIVPQTVFAAGETFNWLTNTTVSASGGDLRASTTLTASGPQANGLYGTLTHRTGCIINVMLLVSFNNSGNLSATASSNDGTNASLCSAEIRRSYNRSITIQGTRPGPGNAPETSAQKYVSVTLYSPSPSSQSPATVDFVFTREGTTAGTTVSSPQRTVDNNPDTGARAVYYTAGINLEPGNYSICPSAIVGCQSFTKVIYVSPTPLTYGESLSSRNITANVSINYATAPESSTTVGPLTVSIQNADGSGTARTMQTNTDTHNTDNNIALVAVFNNVSAGAYRICVADTTVCGNVTKDLNRDAAITLTISGEEAQGIVDSAGTRGDALCDSAEFGELNFFVCPVINMAASAAARLDCTVIGLLIIDTGPVFNGDEGTSNSNPGIAQCLVNAGSEVSGTQVAEKTEGQVESSQAFRTAWGVFRNISFALLLIFGLIMIISQIMGLELFDAYTIRKMLPKLVIAVIFISLSWNIMNFLFNLSNDAAYAVMDLIKAPFSNINPGTGTGAGDLTLAILLPFILTGAVVTGIGLLAILGLGGIGALILSVLLAVFSAFVLLAARNVVAYLLIIAAPLAIICYAFEPFKKLFTLWRTLLITILISVPAIAAIIQMSHVGALVTYTANSGLATVTAIAILIGGYAMIWGVFKKLDAVAGQLGNIVSAATGKIQKGLSDYRGNAFKKRWNEGVEGKRKYGGLGNALTGLGRRARLSDEAGLGAWGVGKRGRAKYSEGVRTMQAGVAAKMMEQDHDRAGGDDDAMKLLAKRGMTEGRFIKEYAALQKGVPPEVAMQRARNALGLSQTSLGARAGTSAMRIAAQKSLLKSNTSYGKDENGKYLDYDAMTRSVYGDVGGLIKDGLITVADGAAMIKANSARADRAGVGFGTVVSKLDKVSRGGVLSADDTFEMADDAINGTGPGQLVGQRHEALGIMGPQMLRRAEEAYQRDGGQVGLEFIQQIAAAAGRRDLAGQLPELNAGLLAANVESQKVAGRTIQQWEEYFRGPASREEQAIFQRYRREYSSAWQGGRPGPGDKPGELPHL